MQWHRAGSTGELGFTALNEIQNTFPSLISSICLLTPTVHNFIHGKSLSCRWGCSVPRRCSMKQEDESEQHTLVPGLRLMNPLKRSIAILSWPPCFLVEVVSGLRSVNEICETLRDPESGFSGFFDSPQSQAVEKALHNLLAKTRVQTDVCHLHRFIAHPLK